MKFSQRQDDSKSGISACKRKKIIEYSISDLYQKLNKLHGSESHWTCYNGCWYRKKKLTERTIHVLADER